MTGLSPKQAQVINDTLHGPRFQVLDGAIRSGKTVSSLLAWCAWLPHAPQGPLAIIGRTRDTIQRNLLDQLALIHPGLIAPVSRHSTTCTMLGREINLIGANDAQAETKVRGLTLAGAYVDEITVLPEPFFVQLLGRLSVPGARLIGTTNPDNPHHWLKTRYLDRSDELHWGYYQFTMDDNPALSEEYIAAKKREFTGLWYRRFIQGAWVSADGAVYSTWDPTTMVVHDLPPMQEIIATGVDYGTTNATSAVTVAIGEDQRLYAVCEARHDSTPTSRPTDIQLSAMIRDHLDTLPARPRRLFLDPAAASLKAQLRADGLRPMDADNSVIPGIQTVAGLLDTGRLLIHDSCTALIQEIPGYSWDQKASDKGYDKVIKVADHSLDALRYAIYSSRTLWRRHIRPPEDTHDD